jgi:hypothetical protein
MSKFARKTNNQRDTSTGTKAYSDPVPAVVAQLRKEVQATKIPKNIKPKSLSPDAIRDAAEQSNEGRYMNTNQVSSLLKKYDFHDLQTKVTLQEFITSSLLCFTIEGYDTSKLSLGTGNFVAPKTVLARTSATEYQLVKHSKYAASKQIQDTIKPPVIGCWPHWNWPTGDVPTISDANLFRLDVIKSNSATNTVSLVTLTPEQLTDFKNGVPVHIPVNPEDEEITGCVPYSATVAGIQTIHGIGKGNEGILAKGGPYKSVPDWRSSLYIYLGYGIGYPQ